MSSAHRLTWISTRLFGNARGNKRLFSSLRNLMVPYFAYGSAFRMSRPDLTPELLDGSTGVLSELLSGASDQTADQVCPVSPRPMSLEGKVAVVTGGARGIGQAVAAELARSGADIVFCDICPRRAGGPDT